MTQAQQFLDAAYEELDFQTGDLVDGELLSSDPKWVEKGDWAQLTKHVRAQKIFFVQGNPVVVFAKQDSDDPEALWKLFRNVWCMSRPNLLFLATPGELAVYDLTKAPPQKEDDWKRDTALKYVSSVSEVASVLKDYHRAQIETGKLFEEHRFGTNKHRADKLLIQDLKRVRTRLMAEGLGGDNLKYAHALIGRSIFIRYLEDRGILTQDYFKQIALKNPKWQNILAASSSKPLVNSEMDEICYIKILKSKEFTYALFNQLAKDFNGDMFPEDEGEKDAVKQKHLLLLQRFFRSDTEEQQKLFFWAYKFDIIPIELVSSIYEEFYTTKTEGRDGKGTHYTPSTLVEFLLSQALTEDRLRTKPVILDPACGSGIFLVEAFRRIVRYRTRMRKGRRLGAQQLQNILSDQIKGIDINDEAIRVAAFSLYLALLHYQKPRDILKQIETGYPLPCLVKRKSEQRPKKGCEYLDILQAGNAFSPDMDMKVDVVVGNPPWGHPGKKEAEKEERAQAKVALDWCKLHELPVGFRERSQAFIWRAIDFLHEDGCAGLLVSSGILHKTGSKSKDFRKKWLEDTCLLHVAHFACVRDVFFANAIAPFAAILFRKTRPGKDDRFQYSSAKMSEFVQSCQAVVLSKNDISWLDQRDFMRNDTLWKTYWLGSHRDAGFLSHLKVYPALEDLRGPDGNPRVIMGRGFQKSGGKLKPAGWLRKYKTLPTRKFTRCEPVDNSVLEEVPEKVHRQPPEREVLRGSRILFRKGIDQREAPKGQILSRYEKVPYAFEMSICGIKLPHGTEREYEMLLGILWSALARYYFFLTASEWALWNDQVLLDELRKLPISFPEDEGTQQAICSAVKALQKCYRAVSRNPQKETKLQRDLDEAVFDAYELCEFERDQVRDMCDVGIRLFYDPKQSLGARPLDLKLLPASAGVVAELHSCADKRCDIRGYLETFLRIWNRELKPDGEFSWRVIAPGNPAPMLAVVFSTQFKGAKPECDTESDKQAWKDLLTRLADDLRMPFHSVHIYVDGLVRFVSPTEIVIIKRNAGRLWTRSAARVDAEATLLKAILLDDEGGEAV